MHVGMVIYGSLETISGGYLYDRKLVDHLRRQGDSVELVALPWRNYSSHLADNFSRSLLARLAVAPFDVLLQDELNHPSLFWLNRRLRPAVSYPVVSIIHHLRCDEQRPGWQNWLYGKVERRYLDSVDAFVFNSETTRASVARWTVAGRPGVVALPAGDRFVRTLTNSDVVHRAHAPGPLRVLFLGNLIPRKGLHTLLQAVARLPESACTLDIVGSADVDPGYSIDMKLLARSLGLAARVQFRGLLPNARVAERLINSHVLAAPSSYEGFGIVYLEGMCFGLPALATTAGGAAEIVRDGENGFLIPPGDPEALAGRLLRLHSERALLARMALDARRSFAVHPTWEQSAARIRAFLTHVQRR